MKNKIYPLKSLKCHTFRGKIEGYPYWLYIKLAVIGEDVEQGFKAIDCWRNNE